MYQLPGTPGLGPTTQSTRVLVKTALDVRGLRDVESPFLVTEYVYGEHDAIVVSNEGSSVGSAGPSEEGLTGMS